MLLQSAQAKNSRIDRVALDLGFILCDSLPNASCAKLAQKARTTNSTHAFLLHHSQDDILVQAL